MDGVFGHHFGSADATKRVFQLAEAVGRLLRKADNRTLRDLYELLVQDATLSHVDPLLQQLSQSTDSNDFARLVEIGRYFATRAVHREAVKLGLALLGAFGSSDDLAILKVLGRNDEFTLFAAVAIARVTADPEQALWELAREVHGWGRIQIVERLKDTKNSEIQSWMLKDGFRNNIMDEYLACICARAGRLHEALNQQFVDDALLDGAADILRALIPGGGPAEGIDDYAHAADTCESYVNLVWARSDLGLKHFLAVASLRRFLSSPQGWDKREGMGWSELRRREVETLCADVLARAIWRQQISEALSSNDESTFYDGDMAAKELSIDTWEVHFKRVSIAPFTSSSWYRLMQQTDEARIDRVLEFAEASLPLEQIATGPGDELGLGPGSELHGTLDWILQDLRRFPLRGWKFVHAGLQSPVVRNRNWSINVLETWPRESWTPEVITVLQKVRDIEPDQKAKGRLTDLLKGKSSI